MPRAVSRNGRFPDTSAIEAQMVEHGWTLLEPYPGSQAQWRVRCGCCGRETTKRWNDVQSNKPGCRFCAERAVAPVDAVASMRANGLEPLDPYPGSHAPWRCRCLACDAMVSPNLNTVRAAGSGCRRCAWKRNGQAIRKDGQLAAELMQQPGSCARSPTPEATRSGDASTRAATGSYRSTSTPSSAQAPAARTARCRASSQRCPRSSTSSLTRLWAATRSASPVFTRTASSSGAVRVGSPTAASTSPWAQTPMPRAGGAAVASCGAAPRKTPARRRRLKRDGRRRPHRRGHALGPGGAPRQSDSGRPLDGLTAREPVI